MKAKSNLLPYQSLQQQAALRHQKGDFDLQIQKLQAILRSTSFDKLTPELQEDLLWSMNELRRRSGVLARRIKRLES
jgi:hypothetical protein